MIVRTWRRSKWFKHNFYIDIYILAPITAQANHTSCTRASSLPYGGEAWSHPASVISVAGVLLSGAACAAELRSGDQFPSQEQHDLLWYFLRGWTRAANVLRLVLSAKTGAMLLGCLLLSRLCFYSLVDRGASLIIRTLIDNVCTAWAHRG